MPTLAHRTTIVLDFPPTSPTSTVTLRNPLMDNEHSLQVTRIFRQTRGLKRSSFRDPQWPVIESFTWTIADLSKTDRDNFLTFVKTSLGKLVRLTDYESRQWDGLINNPNVQSSNVRANCGYTIGFTFEGILV